MKIIDIKGEIVSDDDAWFYEWLGIVHTNPESVKSALEKADGEDVILNISSPGGVVIAGTEIYQMLKEYKGKITAHVTTAMSAATVIACAADTVRISKVGIYMIHNTQSVASGDYRDMDKASEILQTFNEIIRSAYLEKTGMSDEELKKLMDDSTYMSAKEAIEKGFADGYIDTEKQTNVLDIAAGYAMPHERLVELKQMMAEYKELKAENKPSDVVNTEQSPCNSAGTEINERSGKMNLTEFLEQNPEAKAEYDLNIQNAMDTARNEETARLESLDAIADVVPADALHNAKYGSEKMDGKELAFEVAKAGQLKAENYMHDVVNDSEQSGAEDVGVGKIDAGEAAEDHTADDIANYVNARKGGQKK